MSSRQKLPPHGTPERYRIERKTGTTCARCKARMAALRKEQRANAAAAEARAQMHIVEPPSDDTVNDTKPATTRKNSPSDRRKVGEMETAVEKDIEEIDAGLQVPFHRSLSVLARQLARDIDEPSTPPNVRSQYSRQLFEVLRSLRTQKEGDDNSAVAVALQAAGFGVPLVP